MHDMTIPSSTRLRPRIAFWAVAGVALLVSHDAVFLAQLGPGDTLAHTLGHATTHGYWGVARLGLSAIGLLAALAFAIRILHLQRRADALGARPVMAGRAYLRRVARLWPALFAVVAVGFLIQENLEHAVGHNRLLGTGALLGPEYPLALPIIALITLVGGLLGAAIDSTERALATAIADLMRAMVLRPPPRLVRAPLRLAAPSPSPLAGQHAGRAPPSRLASFI